MGVSLKNWLLNICKEKKCHYQIYYALILVKQIGYRVKRGPLKVFSLGIQVGNIPVRDDILQLPLSADQVFVFT